MLDHIGFMSEIIMLYLVITKDCNIVISIIIPIWSITANLVVIFTTILSPCKSHR